MDNYRSKPGEAHQTRLRMFTVRGWFTRLRCDFRIPETPNSVHALPDANNRVACHIFLAKCGGWIVEVGVAASNDSESGQVWGFCQILSLANTEYLAIIACLVVILLSL